MKNKKTINEILIFLLVGITTVVIDLLVYVFLATGINLNYDFSKGVGFVIGTIFSFFANGKLTFARKSLNYLILFKFLCLYSFSLFLNITINQLIMKSLLETSNFFWYAFVIATSVSALLNFIGMKFYVFSTKKI